MVQASGTTSVRGIRSEHTMPNSNSETELYISDSSGAVIGNYIQEANMMVVAEELGLNYEDIKGRLRSP